MGIGRAPVGRLGEINLMRVLVTGHRGYIGTVLTPMLDAAGHEVVGLDHDLYERCTFAPGGKMPQVTTILKDIRDVEVSDLLGFDAVLHLAALSNDPLGDFRPAITNSINYEATMRLARAAKAAGVQRFVFSSSCSNYGASGPDFIDETGTFNPITPYGESKVNARGAWPSWPMAVSVRPSCAARPRMASAPASASTWC